MRDHALVALSAVTAGLLLLVLSAGARLGETFRCVRGSRAPATIGACEAASAPMALPLPSDDSGH